MQKAHIAVAAYKSIIFPLAGSLGALSAGWLSDRFGSRLLCTVGSGLIVVAQFFIASLDLYSSVPRIIFPLALSGLGWALFNAPNQSAILGSVPRDKVGTASGMNTTVARTQFIALPRPTLSV